MSIKIHHGPNGSYKSAGAVQDDMIPAWLDGRLIITNCRGVSAERFSRVLGVPESVGGEVISLDGETDEGRMKIATWFHWAPEGALIFVDEAQAVWPKSWTQVDLRKLDYPGGTEQAEKDGRPHCYSIAWEKHRHWNWDFVLTTPNIKKIRDEIRECADGGYKHKNLALVGLRGRYIEGFHSPQDNGQSKADFVAVAKKRVKRHVFRCYDSTKTGKFSDTISGWPIWKNPRVLLLAFVLVGIVVYLASRPTPAALKTIVGASPAASPVHPATAVAHSPDGRSLRLAAFDPAAGSGAGAQDGGNWNQGADVADLFPGAVLSYGGTIKLGSRVDYLLIVRDSSGERILKSSELASIGVIIKAMGDCLAYLVRNGRRMLLTCTTMDNMDNTRMVGAPVSAQPPSGEPASQSGFLIQSGGTYPGIPPGR